MADLFSHIYGHHDNFLTDYFYTSIFEIGIPGLIVYLTVSSGLFFYFYILNSHKYFPKDADSNWMKSLHMKGGSLRSHVLSELKASLTNIIISIPINGFFHTLVKRGYTKVYYDVNEYGWGYLAFSSFCFVAWGEFWVYWAHYFLHHPKFYFLHKLHHSFIVTTPFCAWYVSIVNRILDKLLLLFFSFANLHSFYFLFLVSIEQ